MKEYTDQEVQSYIENFPGDCILYSLDNGRLQVVAYSQHIPDTFGMSREEYMRMREEGALAGVMENDREFVNKSIQSLIDTQTPIDIYFRIVHKTCGFVWLHTKAKIIGRYGESPLAAVEYLDAELETENINNLLNHDKNLLYVCEYGTWELLYANRAALEYWGRDDYMGKACYEVIRGSSAPCGSCAFWQMKDGAAHIEEQYDACLKRWFRIACRDTTWYGRKAFCQQITDITEARRNRVLLEADNTLIRRIARTVFEFIAIINVESRTIRFRDVNLEIDNAAPTQSSDYDRDNLYAIEHLVIPEEREYCRRCAAIENLVEQLEEKETYSYTWTQPGKGEPDFRKQLTFCWLDESHEEIIAIKSDITPAYRQEQDQMLKLREAVQEAERANRTKSDFLSRMSHDMRTPLNGILGVAELMESKSDLEEIRRDLSQIRLSGRYLLNLVNDTLDINKIERGQLELHPAVCDGKEVFENAYQMLTPEFKRKNIHFQCHMDERVFTKLYIDVGRVEQIFMNILGNAVKFTPEGGHICLTVENLSCEGGALQERMVVEDDGIGIGKEFLPRIFEPFSQEHGGSKSQYEGTGLGMAIVKRITELMGGSIAVDSEQGRGTVCTLVMDLPLASQEQVERQRTAADAGVKIDIGCLEGKRLLLCEDNELNAEITISLLEMKGIQADWARDGREGVGRFTSSAEGYYDAVLMDIRMPVMDGLEAAAAIRALDRADAGTVPIIAMTANAFDEDKENSKSAGMDAHLTKPIDPKLLYETLALKCR